MTREELLAATLKLLAALPVLRWPLAGALIAIAADASDVLVMNYVDLGGGGIRDYHVFDKWTDLPALLAFLAVSLRWPARERRISLALFGWRALGMLLFELRGWRPALIVFPNLFETWFLYVCLRDRFLASPARARRFGPPLLALMVAGKLVQEYMLHVARFLDRFALADVVRGVLSRLGIR